ncbi:MAG: GNAT family N-acetyltransferase [Halobacteriota archaeon]
MAGQYRIRPYASTDRDEFLDLFGDVLDGHVDERWFAWKYENNPFADHVSLVVATCENSLVGARGLFALNLRAGTKTYTALQPCDTMVHPDHRRRGLFTQMTEFALDQYADEWDLLFNFPNDQSLPGNLKLGWRVVEERTTYYRVQDPTALGTPLESFGAMLARSYLRLRERVAVTDRALDVQWFETVPATTLAALADDTVDELHAVRDEEFYRWRFENPLWSYTTAVATDADDPRAAIVVGHRRTDETEVAQLAEVLPLNHARDSQGERTGRKGALGALLNAVLQRFAGCDVVVAPGRVLPRSLLSARGFLGDTRAPLSFVSSPTVHVARPVSGTFEDWSIGDCSLTDPEAWRLGFAEVDSR